MDCKHEPADWYDKNVPPDHHHPGEPWIVDRCADRCDDQLPLFSRVGRGLQGDGYFVRVHHDSDNETILEGLTYDPHTGAYTHDWFSDNINGGILSYKYKFYPYTDPKTFTITFKLDRPGYDEAYPDNPEQRGWEWTTPAIPWVWDDEATHMLGGVGTLFLKKTGAPTWQNVDISGTPNSIAEAVQMVEKLIYPEDTERTEYHAPAPGDPWTVNLTYGIGGDIDCPTTDEFKDHLHKDLYDNKYDSIPSDLKPLNGDGGDASVWDWILYARDYIVFEEGVGIDITETNPDANGKRKVNIAANLEAGDGVKIEDHDGKKKISVHVTEVSSAGAGIGVSHTANSPSDHKISVLLEAGDNISIVNNGNNKKISADLSAANNYAKNLFDKVTDPTSYTADLASVLGVSTVYLVMIKPNGSSGQRAIFSNISSSDVLAAIEAEVTIQFYDSLPDVIVSVVPKNVSATGTYKNGNAVLFGTGEMLIICKSAGSGNYSPVDLHALEIVGSDGSGGIATKVLKEPTANPENLVNSGFGPIGSVSDVSGNVIYDDYTTAGVNPVFNDGTTCYGNWAIYTGVGNPQNTPAKNSRSGGWPWKKIDPLSKKFYIYLFNRSTGYLGTRVWVDYARGYDLTYR